MNLTNQPFAFGVCYWALLAFDGLHKIKLSSGPRASKVIKNIYLKDLFVKITTQSKCGGHTARSAQREPPGLVLEAGGDFNLAGSYACKVEVPPHFKVPSGGDFSSPGMAAC